MNLLTLKNRVSCPFPVMIWVLLLITSCPLWSVAEDLGPYLAESAACRFTPELSAKAAELDHDPAQIYEWVSNNVAFESYAGARKGSQATLLSRSGSDWDQCALLVALLRTSGIPARFATSPYSDFASQPFVEAHIAAVDLSGYAESTKAWAPLVPQKNRYDNLVSTTDPYYTPVKTHKTGYDIYPTGNIPAELLFHDAASMIDYFVDASGYNMSAFDWYRDLVKDYIAENHSSLSLSSIYPTSRSTEIESTMLPGAAPWIHLAGESTATATVPNNRLRSLTVRLYKGTSSSDPKILDHTIALVELSCRRLTIDHIDDGNGDVIPVLRLDGEIIAQASQALVLNQDQFTPVYEHSDLAAEFVSNTFERPALDAGTIVALSVDILSPNRPWLDELKEELADLDSSTAISQTSSEWAERENYLGRVGALLAQGFSYRDAERGKAVYRMLNCEFWVGYPDSFVQVHCAPDAISSDNYDVTSHGLVVGWGIDAGIADGGRRLDDGTILETYDPLSKTARMLTGLSASLDEAVIFEQWQDTPGLSTSRGLSATIQDGNQIAEIVKSGSNYQTKRYDINGLVADETLTEAQLHAIFDAETPGYDTPTQDYLIDLVDGGSTLLLPTGRASISYEDNSSQTQTLEASVWLEFTSSGGLFYSFQPGNGAPSNGGMSAEDIEDLQESFDRLNTTLVVNSDLIGKQDELYIIVDYEGVPALLYYKDDTTNRKEVSAGDPVNVVTGEYYQELEPDLSLPSVTGEVLVQRTYRSRAPYKGIFGYGWTWNLGETLFLVNATTIHYSNSDRQLYEIDITNPGSNETYTLPPGSDFRIEQWTGQSFTGYIVEYANHTRLYFNADNGQLLKKEFPGGSSGSLELDIVYSSTTITIDDDQSTQDLTLTLNAAGTLAEVLEDGAGRKCFFIYGTSNTAAIAGLQQSHLDDLLDAVQRHLGDDTITLSAGLAALGDADDLVATIAADGNVTTYEYLQNQSNEQLNHNMVQCTLPKGDYLKIGHYKNDRTAWHENAKGDRFTFEYSARNRYGQFWNESGYFRKVFWNENHDVIRIDSEDGAIETREFDANHNMTKRVDGNGHVTTYTYDSQNNLTKSELTPAGGSSPTIVGEWVYTYDSSGFFVEEMKSVAPNDVNVSGKPGVVWDYNSDGLLASRTERSVSNTASAIDGVVHTTIHQRTLFNRDFFGRVDSVKLQESYDGTTWHDIHTTQTTFDATFRNLPATQTGAYQGVTTYTYDAHGRPSKIESPAATLHHTYDPVGRSLTTSIPTTSASPSGVPVFSNVYDANGQLVATVDPNGGVAQNVYDIARDIVSGGDIIQVIDPLGNSVSFTYNEVGHQLTATDANGNVLRRKFDQLGRPIKVTDPLGNITYTVYDDNGQPIEISTPVGNLDTAATPPPTEAVTKVSYDEAGRVTSRTDANGEVTSLEYDDSGNQTLLTPPAITGADALRTKSEYDEANRLTKTTINDGGSATRIYERQYDALGRIVKETDACGDYTRYAYDVDSVITPSILQTGESAASGILYEPPSGSTPVARNLIVLRFEETSPGNYSLLSQNTTVYDTAGREEKVVDGNQLTTTFSYDSAGRITETTAPTGTVTKNTYDNVGNLLETGVRDSTQALLSLTKHRYDLANRRVATIRCLLDSQGEITDELVTAFGYDPAGNVVTVTDPEGNVTATHFDAINRPIASVGPTGETTITNYDEAGRTAYIEGPAGDLAEFGYDLAGNRTESIDPLGNINKTVFDARNNVTSRTHDVTDGTIDDRTVTYGYNAFAERSDRTLDGITRHTTYDACGRVDTVTEAYLTSIANSTSYTYDGRGATIAITDGKTETFDYTYDAGGRQTKVEDPMAESVRDSEEAIYGSDGRLLATEKRDGEYIAREYDALDRLVKLYTIPSTTDISGMNNSNIATMTGAALQQAFTYDSLSRIAEAIDYNEGSTAHRVRYAYDRLDRIVSETHDDNTSTASDDNVIARSYDASSNLASISYPGGSEVDYSYTVDNLVATVSLDNSEIATYSYDGARRFTGLALGSDLVLTRTLNARGLENSRQYVDQNDPANGGDDENRYTDTLGDSQTDAYDDRNNVQLQTIADLPGRASVTRTYTYDEQSRLTKVDENSSTIDQWDYDVIGNRQASGPTLGVTWTSNAVNEYTAVGSDSPTYDENGNLLSPKTGTTYTYDWANRLTSVTVGGVTTTYTYDAFHRRVVKQTGSTTTRFVHDNGNVIEEYTNSSLSRSYVHGVAVDEPLLLDNGTDQYFYLTDRLGSVMALADSDGDIVESYDYDAFGQRSLFDHLGTSISATAFGNPYGYTGRRFDAESGLWYYRNRMYDASLGRFLQRDPAGFIDGMNYYAYVTNNPLGFTDPFGLQKLESASRPSFVNWMLTGDFHAPQHVVDAARTTDYAGELINWEAAGKAIVGAIGVGEQLLNLAYDFGKASPFSSIAGSHQNNSFVALESALLEHGPMVIVDGMRLQIGQIYNEGDAVTTGEFGLGVVTAAKGLSGLRLAKSGASISVPTISLGLEGTLGMAWASVAVPVLQGSSGALTGASPGLISAMTRSEENGGTSKNPVHERPRTGSGLKNDNIKPKRTDEDNYGRPILKEFGPEPKGHGFADIIDNFADDATEFALRDGAKLYQVEGSLNGVSGRFEWIVDGGKVTHRQFVHGGTVNGVPIKK